MITVALAEDHQSLIDGIVLFLDLEDDIKIVGTANNGEDLLILAKTKRPKVIIMDIRMPKLDGIQATKKIKATQPEIKVLAFTMFDQTEAIQQMLAAGADGYILKNSSLKTVLSAIRTVASGNAFYDKAIDHEISDLENPSTQKTLLTPRQIQILSLIGQGMTSREIAEKLFIGTHTVDTHRKNMARILGLKGKGELLRYALEKKYDFN
ncbi:MAG: response regulator transcription factor [Leeuwenhoekiella sp.]